MSYGTWYVVRVSACAAFACVACACVVCVCFDVRYTLLLSEKVDKLTIVFSKSPPHLCHTLHKYQKIFSLIFFLWYLKIKCSSHVGDTSGWLLVWEWEIGLAGFGVEGRLSHWTSAVCGCVFEQTFLRFFFFIKRAKSDNKGNIKNKKSSTKQLTSSGWTERERGREGEDACNACASVHNVNNTGELSTQESGVPV